MRGRLVLGAGERERERDGCGCGRAWLPWAVDGVDEEGDLLARCRPRELLPLAFAEVGGGCCGFGAEGGFVEFGRCSSPQWEIRTGSVGLSALSTGSLASFARTDWPETTCPNMVCLAFRCSHGARVMKNL